MPPNAKGRPAKKKRNISGLRNQPAASDNLLAPVFESSEQHTDNDLDADTDLHHQEKKDLASSEQEDDLDSEFESDHGWKGLMNIELGKRLARLSYNIDDELDQDWIPYKLRHQKGKKKGAAPS